MIYCCVMECIIYHQHQLLSHLCLNLCICCICLGFFVFYWCTVIKFYVIFVSSFWHVKIWSSYFLLNEYNFFFCQPEFETKEACELAYFKVFERLRKSVFVRELDLYSSFCISDYYRVPCLNKFTVPSVW
jgi:hypothetical protein